MWFWRTILALCAVIALVSAAGSVRAADENNALTPEEKAKGWRLLFDGKTLDGWTVTGKPDCWKAVDGELTLDTRGGGYVVTKEEFDNFVLSIDFKVGPRANSGIRLRSADPNNTRTRGLEVQIMDSAAKKVLGRNDCGSIYDCVAPTENVNKPAGEWNTMVVTCNRNLITVEQNGKKITEMDLDQWTTANQNPDGSHNKFPVAAKEMARRGHLALQEHPGQVWYRNIKLLPLP